MKKIAFLLFILLCAACTKDSVEKQNVTYHSKPKITVFPYSESLDSLRIKGYSTCTCIHNYKSTLPHAVANDFEMRDSYNYAVFNTIIDIPIGEDERLYFGKNSILNSSIGYNFEFDKRSIHGAAGENYIGTYLIYVESDANGEKIGRWLPIAPEDIDFCAYLLRTGSF